MNEVYYKKYLKYKSLYLNLKSTGGAQPIKPLNSIQDLVSLLIHIKKNSDLRPKQLLENNGTYYFLEIYNIQSRMTLQQFKDLYTTISTNYNTYSNLISQDYNSFSKPPKSTDSHLYIVKIIRERDRQSVFYINRTNLFYLLTLEQGKTH